MKHPTTSLQPGDLVTVVAGPAAVVHVVFDKDTAVIAPAVWRDHNEGIRWIRGHHDVGSDEVLAMLAAWALSRVGDSMRETQRKVYDELLKQWQP